MRYNTRAILVLQAWLAVAIAAVLAGLAQMGDFLGLMLGVLILAPLVGTWLAMLCGIPRRFWKGVSIFVAAAVGIGAGIFLALQVEWLSDGPEIGHPWPESDEWFVALAAVRGGLLGGLVGYIVLKTLSLASRSTEQREPGIKDADTKVAGPSASPSVLRRLLGALVRPNYLAVGAVVLLLIVCWWPYVGIHLEDRAVRALITTIKTGKMDQLPSRVAAVKRYRSGEGAIAGAAFLAMNGRDAPVRLAALEALRQLGETATRSPLVPLLLDEIKQDDSDAKVRSFAESWLERLRSEEGQMAPKR
jgi:hypothetical protein